MAASLTRFEIVLPVFADGSSQQTAVNNFIASITGLTPVVQYTAYQTTGVGQQTQQNVIYGLLTAAQQAQALTFLNTLNAALGSNVLCTVNTVTSEP